MSNIAKRIIISVIGIPILLSLIYLGGIYFLILCIVLQTLCLWEFLSLFDKTDIFTLKYITVKLLTILISIAVFIFLYYKIYPGIIILSLPLFLEVFRENKGNPMNPFLSVFGIIYITIPFFLLSELEKNFYAVIYLFILIWSCDVFAYFGGKLFGKHKLTSVSPNKTIEGSIIGLIFTVVSSLIFCYIKSDFLTLGGSIITGMMIGIVSQVGDNFESLLKRYTEVKDSSTIIPGHGGLLDRFDSLIFAVPFLYLYINFIH